MCLCAFACNSCHLIFVHVLNYKPYFFEPCKRMPVRTPDDASSNNKSNSNSHLRRFDSFRTGTGWIASLLISTKKIKRHIRQIRMSRYMKFDTSDRYISFKNTEIEKHGFKFNWTRIKKKCMFYFNSYDSMLIKKQQKQRKHLINAIYLR